MFPVIVDVQTDDDWEQTWAGEWRVPPQVGMTFEIRSHPGGPMKWYRVIGLHLVMFEGAGYSHGCTVFVKEIDATEVAPKG